MRKVLTGVLIYLISSIALSADKVVGEYRMSLFDKSYEIKASEIKNGKFSIYIFGQGERESRPIFISVDSDKVDEFNKSLLQIRDKFSEWRQIAKDNNVTELKKDVDVKIPNVMIAWYSTEWYFSYRNSLPARYVILDGGRDVIVIGKEATSSSNKYISETIYLTFSEPEEIDVLVSQLNVEKITDKLNDASDTLDLFQ